MAIIQCPECGNKVSSFSEVCPFCYHLSDKNKPIDQVSDKKTIVIPNSKDIFWIYKWIAKVRKTKIILTICLIVSIILLIVSACLLSFDKESIDDSISIPKIIHLVFTIIFSWLVILIFTFWLAGLICCKVRAMRFDGYVVLGYIGFYKNYLVIEDVIKDSGLIKNYFYGYLPNKKQIIMTVLYDIKFEVSNYAGDIII